MRGEYIWDTEEHITNDAIENSATKLIPTNSILVVVKSKVLMHRLPIAIAKVPMCHGQDIKPIQCLDGLHHEFARFVLKHHERRLLNIARGANTEGLTIPMLEELPVPNVEFSEQKHSPRWSRNISNCDGCGARHCAKPIISSKRSYIRHSAVNNDWKRDLKREAAIENGATHFAFTMGHFV